MLELYHSGTTTCSKQVRLALREKGLAYESRYVELYRHEQLAPSYLALNPWGVVPTLVHDGRAIVNSAAINEYLEDVFPEPPLRPSDPADRARMRKWTWAADNLHPAMADATYSAMLRATMSHFSAAELDHLLAAMPAPERRERVRRVATGDVEAHALEVFYDRVGFVFARAEEDLANGPWLAGPTFSLGDISMLSMADRIRALRPDLFDDVQTPRVRDWYERMRARPAVQHVYEEGTAETPQRPPLHTLEGLTG